MKYILLLALSVCPVSCSTYIPTEIEDGKLLGVIPIISGKGSYQVIRRVKGTREEVFRQLRKWASYYSSFPGQLLVVNDNQIGDVIVSAKIDRQTVKVDRRLIQQPLTTYVVSIEAMEGSYRATFTSFKINLSPSVIYPIELRPNGSSKQPTRLQFRAIETSIQKIIGELDGFVPVQILPEH